MVVVFNNPRLLTFLILLAQIAPVENDNSYDELKRDSKMCLSLMSQGLLYPQQVPLVLQVLKQVRGDFLTVNERVPNVNWISG